MKNKFLILGLLALGSLITMSSCNDDDTPPTVNNKLTLEPANATIKADGTDAVTFKVLFNTTDVTTNTDTKILLNGDAITGNTFTTTTAGTYKFTATYGDLTSNEITVTATGDGPPPAKGPFAKKVAIHQFTGAWCMYCPNMKTALNTVKENYKDEIIIMSWHNHNSGYGANDPWHLNETNELLIELTGSTRTSYPNAGIDLRELVSYTVSSIMNTIEKAKSRTEEPVGIGMTTTMSGSSLSIDVDVTAVVEGTYKLCVVVLESGLVNPQKMPNNTIDNNYVHNDVVRRLLTEAEGELIGEMAAGANTTKTFNVTLPSDFEIENGKVVAYVTKQYMTNGVAKFAVNNINECSIGGSVRPIEVK